MEITNGCVATLHYTLTNASGDIIDRSGPDTPLRYLHGAGNIVPGLERALDGRRAGDSVEADVPPEQAYGPRHDGLVQRIARSSFPDVDGVKPGMQFEARTERGPLQVIVTEVDDQYVVVDGNHPLAGQDLHFAVEVAEVREATEQESNDGQVAQVA